MIALNRMQMLIAGGVAAVVVVVAGTTFALSGNSKKTASAPPTSASPSVKPSASSKPAPIPVDKPKVQFNPFTGVGARPTGPVLAVKIDDTENGRPSIGLDQADVIYIEQAEGGLTRMVAVFAGSKPLVEAVRSVRASDAELLSQYGPITLVASGGGGDSLTTLDASAVKGVINDRGGPGFGRDGNRPAPYNLTSNLAAVSAAVHTAAARDIGFTFSKTDAALNAAPVALSVRTVVGSTSVNFGWDSRIGKYVRTIDGTRQAAADGALIARPNVLVQLCSVSVNPGDVDVMGNPSQYTHSIGSGRAVLFRNGRRIEGRWSRPNASSATKFTDRNGRPLLMAPGGTFVALASNGAPV